MRKIKTQTMRSTVTPIENTYVLVWAGIQPARSVLQYRLGGYTGVVDPRLCFWGSHHRNTSLAGEWDGIRHMGGGKTPVASMWQGNPSGAM